MQNQIHNVLQYLFSHSWGPLHLLLFPKKSIPVFTVTVWGGGRCRTCHLQTDSCSKHMRTLKCCHWLSDSVGCSFPLWLSSLAISEEGVNLNQGGSPFCCRAGVGAEAEAGASSTSTGSAAGGHMQPPMDHHDLQPGRRSSCSDICLLLWWQQKFARFRNPLVSFCLC